MEFYDNCTLRNFYFLVFLEFRTAVAIDSMSAIVD